MVEASDKPLTFVIIGVGDADLTEFEVFNDHK